MKQQEDSAPEYRGEDPMRKQRERRRSMKGDVVGKVPPATKDEVQPTLDLLPDNPESTAAPIDPGADGVRVSVIVPITDRSDSLLDL